MTTDRQNLLARYDVPGPRYTSYPTVPYWTDSPSTDQWVAHLQEALQQTREAGREAHAGGALYVHIPFCESLCTYCGCNTRITRNRGMGSPYVDTILSEWTLYRERLGSQSFPLAELHLGGGTPTFLSSGDLGRMVEGLRSGCQVVSGAEFSVEADPRVTSEEQLAVLASVGFRRLSLGIQDFDPKVQQAVNRVQTVDEVRRVVEAARNLGFTSINFDLIHGLPFQTPESIEHTVAQVAAMRPERIAFYGYAHVPWIKPAQRRFTEADLPMGASKRALYEIGRKLLESSGYREVGLDHFALESDSLWRSVQNGHLHRNFMGYTSRPILPLIGLGVSAIGDAGSAFAQNEKVLEPYMDRVSRHELPVLRGHRLSNEDRILRRHILNLMTQLTTRWTEPEDQVPFLDSVQARLKGMEEDGLVVLGNGCCTVTPLGRGFLRNICMEFDARLTRKRPGESLFSRSI